MSRQVDVVIIGKGPAGISAALYTLRAGISTLVIAHSGGELERVHEIENYYGFELDQRQELLHTDVQQLLRLGGELLEEEVVSLEEAPGGFIVSAAQEEIVAKSVILATGRARKKVNIDGVDHWEGKGVSYCAVCDGFFYRNQPVGVLGNGAYALKEAEHC